MILIHDPLCDYPSSCKNCVEQIENVSRKQSTITIICTHNACSDNCLLCWPYHAHPWMCRSNHLRFPVSVLIILVSYNHPPGQILPPVPVWDHSGGDVPWPRPQPLPRLPRPGHLPQHAEQNLLCLTHQKIFRKRLKTEMSQSFRSFNWNIWDHVNRSYIVVDHLK